MRFYDDEAIKAKLIVSSSGGMDFRRSAMIMVQWLTFRGLLL
jgi:predicted PP-loop superfamily ATPase